MKVADMELLVRAAKHFAEAADISQSARNKLDGVCEALAPFQTMDVAAFAELLQQAEQYRRTGILPVPAQSSRRTARRPRPSAEEALKHLEPLVEQLQNLYAVVHEDTVGFGAIDEMCETLGKLTAAEVKAVAGAFGIKVASKTTKKQALDEIKRKLTEQKGSAQRIQPITTL